MAVDGWAFEAERGDAGSCRILRRLIIVDLGGWKLPLCAPRSNEAAHWLPAPGIIRSDAFDIEMQSGPSLPWPPPTSHFGGAAL